MVEGPKVKLKAERLATLHGQIVCAHVLAADNNKQLAKCDGKIVSEVVSVGKELFIVLEPIEDLHSDPELAKAQRAAIRLHFGMDGSERVIATRVMNDRSHSGFSALASSLMPKYSRKKWAAAIAFDSSTLLVYDTTLSMRNSAEIEIAKQRLCRDVMSLEHFSVESTLEILRGDRRLIYESIMDQVIMPGVGNVIKCEGLFLAHIHPNSPTSQLSDAQLRTLICHLRDFSRYWYNCTKRSSRSFQKKVYGHDRCTCCSSPVQLVRDGIQKRITYFCASCQLLPHQLLNSNMLRNTHSAGRAGVAVVDESLVSVERMGRRNSATSTSTVVDVIDVTGSPSSTARELEFKEEAVMPPSISMYKYQHSSAFIPGSGVLSLTDENHPPKSANVPGQRAQQDDASSVFSSFLRVLFCKCQEQCGLQRVRKTGPTSNRLFWNCNGRKCNFFSWADTNFPKCKHGEPSTVRRVLKPGPTNGRYFFTCVKDKHASCGYFLWTDQYCHAIDQQQQKTRNAAVAAAAAITVTTTSSSSISNSSSNHSNSMTYSTLTGYNGRSSSTVGYSSTPYHAVSAAYNTIATNTATTATTAATRTYDDSYCGLQQGGANSNDNKRVREENDDDYDYDAPAGQGRSKKCIVSGSSNCSSDGAMNRAAMNLNSLDTSRKVTVVNVDNHSQKLSMPRPIATFPQRAVRPIVIPL